MVDQILQRCQWVTKDPLYISYHDEEWGVPIFDDQKLFEFIILEGMQAGLSWITILKKRQSYKECFDNFEAEKIVKYNQAKIDALLNNPNIIRNRLKIHSIISNAKAYLELKETQTFSNFLWQYVDFKPIENNRKTAKDIPAYTKLSSDIAKALKKKGFKFVGETIVYAFMQAVGMVNDHEIGCFRHRVKLRIK